MSDPKPINTAMVGIGRWGKNLLRNFAQSELCNLTTVCDLNEKLLDAQKRLLPQARMTTKWNDVLNDPQIEAVVIATKAVSHYSMVKQALEAGKHVYVEKPLTLVSSEAAELVALSSQKKRKLMVGHLMEYHPCVEWLKSEISGGRLGQVYYLYAQRINLGVVRSDENAWWSLAPHDVSVICSLFDAMPVTVSASGQCYLQEGIEDVVFAFLQFEGGRCANIHVSWLDPHKIRKLTVVGSERMATFDDMEATEKMRIYDKGAVDQSGTTGFADAIAVRSGDILIPKVPQAEPLKLEVTQFLEGVVLDKPIRTDGANGLRVVKVLEAGTKSLAEGGRPISVEV